MRTPKITKETMLTLGYALGPFFVVTLLLIGIAILDWPKNSILNWATYFTPVFLGAICYYISLKRLNLNLFWVIPYVTLYFFAVVFFAVIPAILLGAPK